MFRGAVGCLVSAQLARAAVSSAAGRPAQHETNISQKEQLGGRRAAEEIWSVVRSTPIRRHSIGALDRAADMDASSWRASTVPAEARGAWSPRSPPPAGRGPSRLRPLKFEKCLGRWASWSACSLCRRVREPWAAVIGGRLVASWPLSTRPSATDGRKQTDECARGLLSSVCCRWCR